MGEVLAAKELAIDLAVASLLPLLSLLEATVKDPLQKPLMTRTRTALRKVTNIRRFAESSNGNVEELVKLLQSLFLKPFTKKTLMPYIGEDLVQCCSFVLRCALHISREETEAPKSAEDAPRFEMEDIFKLYQSNLSKFFLKRDSSFPYGIFVRSLQYPWPDAGYLLEPLIEYAFGASILKNRKLQALQLLTALFRNTTALSAIGPHLNKQLHSLLQQTQKVVEEAAKDSKPKYLTDLFTLLRVMYQCPVLVKLDGAKELWQPLQTALPLLPSRGVVKQKELKRSFTALARVLQIAHTIPSDEPDTVVTTEAPVSATKDDSIADTVTDAVDTKEKPKKKKSKNSFEGSKDRSEAKKRRLAAAAEGVVDVTFAVDGFAEAVDDGEPAKKRSKKDKKKKGKPKVQEEEAEEAVEMEVAQVTVEKRVTRKRKKKTEDKKKTNYLL